MPIGYDCMREGWRDTEDPSFFVDMTPEGGCPAEEFDTQDEFWAWYRNA